MKQPKKYVIPTTRQIKERVGLERRSGTWVDAMGRVLAKAFPEEKQWKRWRE